MKSKNCPFCSEEISDEAIICKYCHKLLIDEKGNDITAEQASVIAAEEAGETEQFATEQFAEETAAPAADTTDSAEELNEDKTIIYSKEELNAALEEAADGYEADTDAETVSPAEEENTEEYELADENFDEPQDGAEESAENVYDDDADYNAKRTFILTAIITLGILIVIIASVCVGYKLFGAEDSSSDLTSNTVTLTDVSSSEVSEAEEESSEYEPAVTDETLSEEPEEVVSDDASDDTEVSETDSSAEDDSSDSESAVSEESSEDASETSSVTGSADGAPSFQPAGGYYSWDEAFTLFEAYLTANSLSGSWTYYGGTDGVEMNFSYTEHGNTTIYRVDLQTGYITAQ